ncbi:MAG: DUF2511 domain-containing protein [Chloroflexi bacterium]|nr:DUF2511 domain-containing protein [Chloroflexota bacterium]
MRTHISIAILSLILAATVLVACGGGKDINRSDYGSRWPFTVDSATLHCDRQMVWVEANGRKYALNGTAQTHLEGALPLERIWRRSNGVRVNIGPMIREGLALCD